MALEIGILVEGAKETGKTATKKETSEAAPRMGASETAHPMGTSGEAPLMGISGDRRTSGGTTTRGGRTLAAGTEGITHPRAVITIMIYPQ